MSQNHSVTKRNRRQVSHTRGHEGQATQLALRSTEATFRALRQENEVADGVSQLAAQATARRAARDARRNSVRKP